MFSVITSGVRTMTDKIPSLLNLVVPPFRAYTSHNVILELVFISAMQCIMRAPDISDTCLSFSAFNAVRNLCRPTMIRKDLQIRAPTQELSI